MQRGAGDRIGTTQSPDIDPDYHWNSFVPHLLAVAPRAVNRTIARKQEHRKPDDLGNRTPLVELRHYTPYPETPEATWAQPLTREELS